MKSGRHLLPALIGWLLTAFAVSAWAYPELDTTFNGTGKSVVVVQSLANTEVGRSVIQQADGRLVAAGYSDAGSQAWQIATRFNADGTLDTGFGTSGKYSYSDGAGWINKFYSVIQRADSSLMLGGIFNTQYIHMRILNAAGVPTKSRQSASVFDAQKYIQLQSQGFAVVGYSHDGSKNNFRVAMYEGDIDLDSSFGTGGAVDTEVGSQWSLAYALTQQLDGKLVVVGRAANGGNNDDFAVVRYLLDGSLDSTFGTGGLVVTNLGTAFDYAYDVVQQRDGKLLVVGQDNFGGGNFAVVRYNSDGTLDTSFNSTGKLTVSLGAGKDVARAVKLQADGKILVAGYTYNGTHNDLGLVRLNSNGTLDTTFGTAGIYKLDIGSSTDDLVYDMVFQANGKLVLTGSSDGDFFVTRLTLSGDTDLDGIDDSADNCVLTANAGQEDADADGKGDVCDLAISKQPLAAGSAHTCAIKESGGVQCWGSNYSGQLGDGTFVSHISPVDVVGLSDVVAVAAGDNHSCALDISGAVKCWGANNRGQLGDGTVFDTFIPTQVSGLGNDVVAIAASASHSCAITSSGAMKCWGDNEYGQLGDGTSIHRFIPTMVSGLNSGVMAMAAGDEHSCAIVISGQVKCWGNNSSGQLGDGTTTQRLTPVAVNGVGYGAVAITAAVEYSCAITSNGGAKCWGNNNNGQLGTSTNVGRLTPVWVSGFGSGVVAIAAGGAHSCAINSSKAAMKCWGYNGYGQLGDGTTIQRLTPVMVSGLSDRVVAIAAGRFHSCALAISGTVQCWGYNYGGQLGDGTTTHRLTPVAVFGVFDAGSGIDIDSDGLANSVDTDDDNDGVLDAADNCPGYANPDQRDIDGDALGDVCDSDNDNDGVFDSADADDDNDGVEDYQDAFSLDPAETVDTDLDGIGNNTDTDDDGDGLLDGADNCPLTVNPGQQDVDADAKGDVCDLDIGKQPLAAGNSHTCAITESGGVQCWGSNGSGQLGNGSTTDSSSPVNVIGLSDVVAVAAGDNHSCALDVSGTVKCWGYNYSGQLGDGTIFDTLMPVAVSGLGSDVVAIAAGNYHSCALTSSGAMKCWGSNSNGQLGDGTTTLRLMPVAVSGFSSGVAAITVGGSYTCALTSSGAVKCWGYNGYGGLGDGTKTDRLLPQPVTGLGSGVVSIAIDDIHSCALDVTRAVKCWGYNGYGQLGDGTTTQRLTPVTVTGLDNDVMVAVSVGGRHSCALTSGGAMKCWGRNYEAQLGDGTVTSRSMPVAVNGLSSDVLSIAAGYIHTCALDITGTVKCWGSNDNGQLGDGTITNRSVPVVAFGVFNAGPGPDTDGDGLANSVDTDDDNDGVLDEADNCPNHANTDQRNIDNDELGDACDQDNDNDGVFNATDTDDDNDGVEDIVDAYPLDPTESMDTDQDGIGNNADTDDDGDGVLDGTDNCALVVNSGQEDADADGKGDVCDLAIRRQPLAAGNSHTCAITESGGVQCWGYNYSGQLGDGTTINRSFPTNVIGLSDVLVVVAGSSHSCALTASGAVKCWGYNYTGQLGDGTTSNRSTPVTVIGLGSDVVDIAAGSTHTCALTSIGAVKCWGQNNSGQLGNGTTINRLTPGPVSGLGGGVVAIATGSSHSCALDISGSMKCWGYNNNGQLGDGTTTQRLAPVAVSGSGSGVVAISASVFHSCALDIAGAVKCWGNNNSGQLGDGTTVQRLMPVAVSGLSGDVTAISNGGYHSCALDISGTMKCWGQNYSGQLGDGTITQRLTPVAVSGLSSGTVSIAAGNYHSCALDISGTVQCWGSNDYGGLGDGTTIQRLTPVAVSGVFDAGPGLDTDGDGLANSVDTDDDNDGVLDVADNCPHHANPDQHNNDSDALGDVCDPDNDNDGILDYDDADDDHDGVVDVADAFPLDASESLDTDLDGIGNNTDTDDDGDGLLDVSDNCALTVNPGQEDADADGKGDVCDLGISKQSIAAGNSHTCAITESGGVQCWGSNSSGQLGDGTKTYRKTPVNVIGLSDVVAVTAGDSHSCALLASGAMKCWGSNDPVQVVNGSQYYGLSPVAVIGLGSDVVAITSGASHTCALTSSGAMSCWGQNNYGQLGDGTINDRATPAVVVGLGSGVVAIAAGTSHSCAIISSGAVKCWGNNYYRQLGDGTTTQRLTPAAVIGLDSGVVAITASGYHSCALDVSGAMKCWGDNDNGQLGNGTTTQPLTPVAVSGLTANVEAITAGRDHSCALETSGAVKCWGYNGYGRLGDSTTIQRLTPVMVSGLSDGVVAIAAGGSHSCAITLSGTVQCWGANDSGQLGDGTITQRLTPVAVFGVFDAGPGMDTDGDGLANSVDTDDDNDGVLDVADNCPSHVNPDQHDRDSDALGDVCDPDDDNDGINDESDADNDNDGIEDIEDAFPLDASESVDTDQDGIGNNADTDDDGDGVLDGDDNCALTANQGQADTDANGKGDVCDLVIRKHPLAAGRYHTCAITESGGVQCWGYNSVGQLGDGTTSNRLGPVTVVGLSDVVAVAAGSSHSCALDVTGAVKCWGNNNNGQLGDGTLNSRSVPVVVNGLSSNVVAITAGALHNCALTGSGAMKCWGSNYNGRLGDGTTTQRLTPVAVIGLSSGVMAIAASGSHSCAITSSGAMKCWGANDYGQLGDGTSTQRLTPVAVSGLGSEVSAIAAGELHTCALDTSGAMKCWGYNYYGQLGDGTSTQRLTPVSVSGLVSGVVAITAGASHSCALTSTGTMMKCWGENYNGQLGDGTGTSRSTPVAVIGLSSDMVAIDAGNYHSCTLDRSGRVKCWGSNSYGQLGDGTTSNRYTPAAVFGVFDAGPDIDTDGDGLANSVDTDDDNDGVLDGADNCPFNANPGQYDNDSDALGDACDTDNDNDSLLDYVDTDDDNDGVEDIVDAFPLDITESVDTDQDGIGNNTDSDDDGDGVFDSADNCALIINPGQEDVDADGKGDVCDLAIRRQPLAAGSDHTCAITESGGVQCWGSNSSGQLGDGTTTTRTSPVTVTGLINVIAIAAGGSHSCALDASGAMKCWGYNYQGQLGGGTTTQHLTPVAVSGLGSDVVAITAGANHSCALVSSGAMKCWGSNANGQLGDGTTTNRFTPVAVNGFGSGVGVLAIEAGSLHSCAITSGGAMKCWGYNGYGQLGDGTTNTRLTPVAVSDLSSDVVAMAASEHSCALISSGAIKCWGSNANGQLGDGTTTQRLTPVAVSGLSSDATAITAGASHSCTLDTSGAMKCWGYNYYGQLGDGTTTRRLNPVAVSGLSGAVVAIAAGESHSCALALSGAVKCWGSNDSGRLGDGTTIQRLTPVAVFGVFDAGSEMDTDGDGLANNVDTDDDNDGVLDVADNCRSYANLDQRNNDGDALGDICDPDNDNDGIYDYADTDDDNDGIEDYQDVFPLDSTESVDTDQDGTGNNADTDDDGDGLLDGNDNCALTANPGQEDMDADGNGDVCDLLIRKQPLAAGTSHTCAITESGDVQCWGSNSSGELGDGTTITRSSPVTVAGLSDVVAVAVGSAHSCALTSSGAMKCWGSNYSGQLGDGTLNSRSAPVVVNGLSSNVVAITVGDTHSCALNSSGALKCWGANYNGQLGDNTTSNRFTPVAVSGLSSGVMAIAAGTSHSCAITSSGEVKCWGYNYNGQLGDGTTTNRLTPVAVSGLGSGVAAITAGESHSCALEMAGAMKCWGYNGYGQLGDGTNTQRYTPVAVSGVGSGVVAIAAGESHSCALDTSGAMKCWGYNGYGQLGDGTTTQRLTPMAVSGLSSGVVAIAAGASHSCSLTLSGAVKCWGYNGYGQLGDGTMTQRLTPVAVFGVFDAGPGMDTDSDGLANSVDTDDDNDGVLDVADNCPSYANPDQHDLDSDALGDVCDPDSDNDGVLNYADADDDNDGVDDVVDDFPLVASESLDTDQDGTGNNADTDDDGDGLLDGTDNCALIANAGQEDVDADGKGDVCDLAIRMQPLAVGTSHTCAITESGGVQCWGYNYSGQLGDGTTINRSFPTNVIGLSDVVAVAAGDSHSCALNSNGAMKCWGSNSYGQLGDGTTTQRLTPVEVSDSGSDVVAITAGASHTCALTSSGSMKCWGNNNNGQLGDGTTVQRSTPVAVSGLSSGVMAIAAGASHSCAITSSGATKCWGNNYNGQLGDGTTTQRLTPVAVSGLSSNVVAITVGYSHSCVLDTSGAMKCWGYNGYGQLGDGTITQRLTPVAVSGLSSDATAITAGESHSCALDTSGAMKCWGTNYNGQLGDGTTTQRLTPLAVSGLSSGLVTIAAGGARSCALDISGSVKCWGYNGYGQLGDGTMTQRLTPVAVFGVFDAGPGMDTDGDGLANNVDTDDDNDGVLDVADNCRSYANPDQHDDDGDALGDICDPDNDNDGVLNYTDADDDNDGIADVADAFPLDASESLDTDQDGIGNNTDTDDDGDGLVDVSDNCALTANTGQEDTDADGKGDVCDLAISKRLLATGIDHSCAITATGGVQCWGRNDYGQLGDGTTVSRNSPVNVVGLSNVVAVATGDYHSCALVASGAMTCWGQNNYGQLGDGTTSNRSTPVAVSSLGNDVAAITAGSLHSCVLTNSGAMKCWGYNYYGQLGNGTVIDRFTPAAVSGLSSGVVAVATGNSHSCALLISGAVKCWGYNYYGQLGDGTTTVRLAPVAVNGLSAGIAAITAGSNHSCARDTSGTMKCWGYNVYGQLGDGTYSNRSTPVAVSGLGSEVLAIKAGSSHSCVLTNSGAMKCWGRNYEGQLGDGTTSNRLTPVAVSGLASGIFEISAGGAHSCALNESSVLKCWGYNNYGQLGDGSTSNRTTPVIVSGVFGFPPDTDKDGIEDALDNCPLSSNADQLNTDGDAQGNVCDLDDDNDGVVDTSDAFPLNAAETLDADGDGIGNNADSDDDNDGVLDVADNCPDSANPDQHDIDNDALGDVCDPDSDNDGIYDVTDTDDDNDGVEDYQDAFPLDFNESVDTDQDGIGNNADTDDDGDGLLDASDNCVLTANPAQEDVDVDGKGDVCDLAIRRQQLSVGNFHTCAITESGGVQCWGYNGYGQLGDGTTTTRSSPVNVVGLSDVAAVAVGNLHTCVITENDGVKCWGYNYYGQLGDGTNTDRLTPVAVSGLSSDVVAITLGTSRSCALTSSGAVKCWGRNNFGQLGDGTSVNRLMPMAVSTLSSGVLAITAGDSHSCAPTSSGGVKCWGDNGYGQLGDGTNTNRLIPAAVSGLGGDVVAIAGGGLHSCALASSGALQCWGNNSNGQLGDGTTAQRLTPVAVSGLSSSVVGIAAGGSHSCALDEFWAVKCWGYNYSGQLGDGTNANRLTPVAVNGLNGEVVVVAAGGSHSCALNISGAVKCWGDNSSGQLGNGTTVQSLTPVNVPGVFSVPPDIDKDGIEHAVDNCPLNSNADQLDTDSDGEGNVCDTDDDNDTIADEHDRCPIGMPCTALDDLYLDAGFGNSGRVLTSSGTELVEVNDMVVQADGKLLLAGAVGTVANIRNSALWRYNADGTLDSSFGTNGKVVYFTLDDDSFRGVTVQPDGRIVAVGQVCNFAIGEVCIDYNSALVRYSSNGALDTTFGSGGVVSLDTAAAAYVENLQALQIQPDGKIVAAGYTCVNYDLGATTCLNYDTLVLRLNSNGSLDGTFGAGGLQVSGVGAHHDQLFALALQTDGKLVAAGRTCASGSCDDYNALLMRLNSDGSLDTTFATGGIGSYHSGPNAWTEQFNAVAVQSDGAIVAAGYSCVSGAAPAVCFDKDMLVYRTQANGSIDSGYGVNGAVQVAFGGDEESATGLVLAADGSVWAAGYVQTDSNTADFAITHVLANGTLDTAFSNDGKHSTWLQSYNYGNALLQQQDGKLVMAGVSQEPWASDTSESVAILRFNIYPDSDEDGVPDATDAFPFDAAETLDTDNDGIGNNADLDDDGDGVPDYIDAEPLNAAVNTESIMPLEGVRKGSVIRDAMSVQ